MSNFITSVDTALAKAETVLTQNKTLRQIFAQSKTLIEQDPTTWSQSVKDQIMIYIKTCKQYITIVNDRKPKADSTPPQAEDLFEAYQRDSEPPQAENVFQLSQEDSKLLAEALSLSFQSTTALKDILVLVDPYAVNFK